MIYSCLMSCGHSYRDIGDEIRCFCVCTLGFAVTLTYIFIVQVIMEMEFHWCCSACDVNNGKYLTHIQRISSRLICLFASLYWFRHVYEPPQFQLLMHILVSRMVLSWPFPLVLRFLTRALGTIEIFRQSHITGVGISTTSIATPDLMLATPQTGAKGSY